MTGDPTTEPLDELAVDQLGELAVEIGITQASISAGALTLAVVAGLEHAARTACSSSRYLAQVTEAEAEDVREAAGEDIPKHAGPDERARAAARRDLNGLAPTPGTTPDEVELCQQAARLASRLERAVRALREYSAGVITEALDADTVLQIARVLDTTATYMRRGLASRPEVTVIQDNQGR